MEVSLATESEILMSDIEWANAYGKALDTAAECVHKYWNDRAREGIIQVNEFRGLIRAYGIRTVINSIEDTLYDQSRSESDGMYSNTFRDFIKTKHEA